MNRCHMLPPPPPPAGGHGNALALLKINALLSNRCKCDQLVESLFEKFAGSRQTWQHLLGMQRLQEHEALQLGAALGEEIGLPAEVFGDMHQMFHRFDFSGAGELSLEESKQLVVFILRSQRDSLAPPKPGTRLLHLPKRNVHERYKVQRQLGQGGQGAVYLAKDKTSGNDRVVKFCSKANANAPLDGIKEEFAILKRLDHPRVARILEVFEDTANVYVVSEPYFGGDLTTLMTKAQKHGVVPTVTWVGNILKQVLEGVSFLHSNAIMHCDLKEDNIMIAHASEWHAPHVVIIDFGLAKDFGGLQRGGTPGYMPPEVWQMNLWTPKGDVFSLSVIIWSIFSGKRGGPFWVPDTAPFKRVKELTINMPMDCSWLPEGLWELTERMSSKGFRQRPTARAVLQDRFFQELGKCTEPVSPVALEALEAVLKRRTMQNVIAMEMLSSHNLGQLRHLNELFEKLDVNGDGTVCADEAREGLRKLGVSFSEAEALICSLMGDSGGEVHYSEFMAKLLVAQRGLRSSELAEAFASIDTDHSGSLDRREIETLLARPGMARMLEGKSAAELLKEMDRDGNGVVDFQEFQLAVLGEPKAKVAWAVGDAVQHFSRSHGQWVECRIAQVDARSGAVMLDVKSGHWLRVHEQQQVLRRPAAQSYTEARPTLLQNRFRSGDGQPAQKPDGGVRHFRSDDTFMRQRNPLVSSPPYVRSESVPADRLEWPDWSKGIGAWADEAARAAWKGASEIFSSAPPMPWQCGFVECGDRQGQLSNAELPGAEDA